MADNIVDNRTIVDQADTVGTVWVDLGGTALTVDAEIFIETTGSMGNFCTTVIDGIFYRWSADQDLTSTHIYLWVNCGVVSLLDVKGSQGLTFRARGPTVTNFLEWDYGGSDAWPTTFEGGWFQMVIDISSTPTRTGGTPPAITAIREVGITFITATVMPRMADNIWVDVIRSLPDGTPGIIVEGQSGGTTPWTWSDLPTQLGAASGAAIAGPAGSVILNTPVEFFADDAADHVFTSLNETVLWDNLEFVASDSYGITVLGAATGTADWDMGVKTGTGATATGAQGGAIIADSAGVRWSFDADAANIDSCNLYGVTMQHGGDFQLDTATNEVISSLFIDIDGATGSNSNALLSNSYIDPNTTADTGTLTWNENVSLDGIIDGSTFEMGAANHHAIDFGTAILADTTIRNCAFNGFGGTDDSDNSTVRFLAGSGSLNLNLIGCTVDGSAATALNFSVDDAAGIVVTVVIDPVDIDVTVKDQDGVAITSARVAVYDSADAELMNELTNGSGFATEPFSGSVPENVVVYVRKSSTGSTRYEPFSSAQTITSAGLVLAVTMQTDTIASA